jgi:hypothetical protein
MAAACRDSATHTDPPQPTERACPAAGRAAASEVHDPAQPGPQQRAGGVGEHVEHVVGAHARQRLRGLDGQRQQHRQPGHPQRVRPQQRGQEGCRYEQRHVEDHLGGELPRAQPVEGPGAEARRAEGRPRLAEHGGHEDRPDCEDEAEQPDALRRPGKPSPGQPGEDDGRRQHRDGGAQQPGLAEIPEVVAHGPTVVATY